MALGNQSTWEENYFAATLIVRTGVTIAAGRPIIVDVSGTDIVSNMTSAAEITAWIGMIKETLTGPHTGVPIATRGIFEFTAADSTVEAFTGAVATIGAKVWFVSGTLVRPLSTTAATLTGTTPLGIVVAMPDGDHASGVTHTVHIDIDPQASLNALT